MPLGVIRDYEQDRRQALFPSVLKLARALGVSPAAFDAVDDRPPAARRSARGKRKKGEAT